MWAEVNGAPLSLTRAKIPVKILFEERDLDKGGGCSETQLLTNEVSLR